MCRFISFMTTIVLVLIFSSCNDSSKDFSNLAGPTLSAADGVVDLGYTWEMTFKEGNGITRKEVYTTAKLWDGSGELQKNTLYRLDFDQAERVFADNPDMLKVIDQLRRGDFTVEPKLKSRNTDQPQLAWTEEESHFADAYVSCYYDQSAGKCKADAWLTTGVQEDGYRGMKENVHSMYNVTMGWYIDTYYYDTNQQVAFSWGSHIYNYTTYQCPWTIRGLAWIQNDYYSINVEEFDEDNGM